MKKNVDLKKLGYERLKIKKQRMRNLLKIALPDEALYREIMLSLGYKNNKIQFLELAIITPYSEIKKLKNKKLIELALLHRGGFLNANGKIENFDFSLKMDKKVWHLREVRPQNFPQNRIKQVAELLSQTIDKGIFNFFKSKIEENYFYSWGDSFIDNQKTANKIVKRIMDFKSSIGLERKQDMFFNIFLPFYLVIYEDEQNYKIEEFLEKLYNYHKPLSQNSITKSVMKKLKINKINSVIEFMGLIQFYYEERKERGNEEN